MLYPVEFGIDPLFPHIDNFSIVEKDDTSGKGVMACTLFRRGEVIAKMHGHIVHTVQQHTLEIDDNTHNFDPYFSGYFLHSCKPNISLNMHTMLVTALQDIFPGDFLYMDYAETESYLFRQFQCKCGHDNCRGIITGKKELPHPVIVAHALRAYA